MEALGPTEACTCDPSVCESDDRLYHVIGCPATSPSSRWTGALLPFSLVLQGNIPTRGSAVKDGYFYVGGERIGRVLSVVWDPYPAVIYDGGEV